MTRVAQPLESPARRHLRSAAALATAARVATTVAATTVATTTVTATTVATTAVATTAATPPPPLPSSSPIAVAHTTAGRAAAIALAPPTP